MSRRVGQAMTWLVLLTSGTYLLVYLYRWQWNRALVAGMFFVSAEVAVAAGSILRRLVRMEARLDQLAAPPPATGTPSPLEHLRATAPEPRAPFAWLEPGRTNVFVPVLLGAGALISVLAAAVERVAGATARPALERGLARRLQPLTLPAGGLLGPLPGAVPMTPAFRAPLVFGRLAAALVAVMGVAVVVDVVADATQNGGDVRRNELVSDVTIEISHREAGGVAVETAESLWAACRPQLVRGSTLEGITDLGGGRLTLVVHPAIGEFARRRFSGCIQDVTLDRVQATIVGLGTRQAG